MRLVRLVILALILSSCRADNKYETVSNYSNENMKIEILELKDRFKENTDGPLKFVEIQKEDYIVELNYSDYWVCYVDGEEIELVELYNLLTIEELQELGLITRLTEK